MILATFALGRGNDDRRNAPESSPSPHAGIHVRALKIAVVRELDLVHGAQAPPELPRIHPRGSGLCVLLDVSGERIPSVIEFGHIQLSVLTDDRGRHISIPEFDEQLDRVDRESMFFGVDNVPTDSLWIELELPLPKRDAKTLTVVGALDVVLAQRRELSLPDVASRTGRVDWPELESAGLTCTISRGEDDATIATFEGDPRRVINADLMRGDAKAYGAYNCSRSHRSRVTYTFWPTTASKDALRLRVEIAQKKGKTEVPFRLVDLPLP